MPAAMNMMMPTTTPSNAIEFVFPFLGASPRRPSAPLRGARRVEQLLSCPLFHTVLKRSDVEGTRHADPLVAVHRCSAQYPQPPALLSHEDLSMIIDTHTHVWSFPSYRDLSQHIKTTEDLIAFRTRYPELYNCSLTEEPVDNSDALIADMDKNGVALTLVQARPGYVTNDQVAQAAARHSDRLQAIARVGHDQEAAGYHDDPGPTRERAPEEIERCLTKLKMKGVGEIFIRSLTNEIHPERIANDLDGLMKVVSKHGVPIQFPTAWSQFPGGLFYGDPLWVDEVALRHSKVPITNKDGTERRPLLRQRDDGRDAQR